MPDLGGQLTVGHVGHVVQFYGDDEELSASVARFLGEGLAAGDRPSWWRPPLTGWPSRRTCLPPRASGCW